MKRLLKLLMHIKTRYYVATIIVLTSMAVTPAAVRSAYEFRGYSAVGGEYLLIPLGVILSYALLAGLKDYDDVRERRKKDGRKRTVTKDFSGAETTEMR